MAKPKGYVLQRGISPIDGNPFVVIATMHSENSKTGDMIQVTVLREDVDPKTAIETGDDYTVCGNCRHRKQPDGTRSCYVDVVRMGPQKIYEAYKNKRYGELSELDMADVQGRKIRWGTYGDPSIIDTTLVKTFNGFAAGHTGYTHQWRQPWAQWCKGVFMASCDSKDDYHAATEAGWKTYTVLPKQTKTVKVEPYGGKLCPYTRKDAQSKCLTCTLCSGNKVDIYIEAHGKGAKYV